MVSSRSVLKTAWKVKKLQNVQTGPTNYANPYRFIVYKHVIMDAKQLWLLKDEKQTRQSSPPGYTKVID